MTETSTERLARIQKHLRANLYSTAKLSAADTAFLNGYLYR